MNSTLIPPWAVALTPGEHTLVLAGLVVTGLILMSTLVRVRFGADESRGVFRTASMTASAVVAIALVSYIGLVAAFLAGYEMRDGLWRPGPAAQLAWALRYTDWAVTVPLLVVELVAISALPAAAATRTRRIGMTCAALMVACGFLGAFVVRDGTDFTSYAALGVAGAVFFGVLYLLIVRMLMTTLPRIPVSVRPSYRNAVVLLVTVWLIYPIVYGIAGVAAGGVWVVVGQLAFCAADAVAKVGFGTLVHRTAVLRSRAAEDADPSPAQRPRLARAESVWVADDRRLELDEEDQART